ncbi:MAG TPA: glycosyltransferase family 39 protein [Tepidisphaeraceae bacterium]
MSIVQPSDAPSDVKRVDQAAVSRGWFFAAIALLLTFGLVALVAGVIGPQRVLNHSFLLAPADGNHLSTGRARGLLWLARFGACGALLLVVIAFWRRPVAERTVGRVVGEFKASSRALFAAMREEVSSFPAAGWLSLAIVTLLGAAVRIRYLFEPLRYDEAFTYCTYAARPLRAFLQDYSWPNNHIFHTILVHASTRLLGFQPWAIRLPALVAGILTIPLTGVLFRRLVSPIVGLLAAALVAGSSILIEYSVNARGYSIQTLLFVALLALALHLRRRASLAGWVLLVVLSSIGFFTIPTMLYPFGIVLGWLVLMALFARDREPVRKVLPRAIVAGIATAALSGVLYSPILLYHGRGPLIANQFVAPMTLSQWVHGLPLGIERVWQLANRGWPLAFGVVLSLGIVLYVVLGRGERRRDVPLLLVALLWCPLLVAIQRVIPFTRVWVFLEPIYGGLAAAGIVALIARGRDATRSVPNWILIATPAAVALLVAAFVIRSGTVIGTNENFPQAIELAGFFDGNLSQGDRVLAMFPAEAPLRYQGLTHPALGRATAPTARGDRRLIVVIQPGEQTPEEVPKALGVAAADYDPPRLIHSISGAAVYELRHRGS